MCSQKAPSLLVDTAAITVYKMSLGTDVLKAGSAEMVLLGGD